MGSLLLRAIAGLLGVSFNYCGLGTPSGDRYSSQTLVYDFPVPLPNGTALFPMRECKGFQLEEANIDNLQTLLSSRALSSVDLVSCYESRIYQTSSYLKYATESSLIASEVRLLTATKCRNAA